MIFYKIILFLFSFSFFSCVSKTSKINSNGPKKFNKIDLDKDKSISPEEFEIASSASSVIDGFGPSIAFAAILFLIILFCFLAKRVNK